MLSFRTTISLSIFDGSEEELDLIIRYEFNPGTPETGAGYLADPMAYDPGSADEINIVSITLIRKQIAVLIPRWLDRMIREDEALMSCLAEEAKEAA
jgi:hypothetical protein